MAKGKKTGGRRPGVPNKATADVRAAIAQVLQGNVENFNKWLLAVAEGEQESEPILDDEGQPVHDSDGKPKRDYSWLRRPDPGKALDLSLSMAEYHIPKLSRTEVKADVDIKGTPIVRVEFVNKPPSKSTE